MKKQRPLLAYSIVGMMLLALSVSISAQDCAATDYDCRINKWQAAIRANPDSTEAYYNLGIAFQGKGDHAQAVAMFDKYLTRTGMKPEYRADGYAERGFSKAKLGMFADAVADYSLALEITPGSLTFLRARGNANNNLKSYTAGLADYTKVFSLGGKEASDYFGRGVANMGLKNNAIAIPDFSKVIEIDPENAEAYYNRGTCYYRTSQYSNAIADLDKYIGLNDAKDAFMADGFENRGLAHFSLAHYSLAVDDFTHTIGLSPTRKTAYQNRARAYRKLNKVALAVADEKKANEIP